jgi:hypothetical protein
MRRLSPATDVEREKVRLCPKMNLKILWPQTAFLPGPGYRRDMNGSMLHPTTASDEVTLKGSHHSPEGNIDSRSSMGELVKGRPSMSSSPYQHSVSQTKRLAGPHPPTATLSDSTERNAALHSLDAAIVPTGATTQGSVEDFTQRISTLHLSRCQMPHRIQMSHASSSIHRGPRG